MSPSQIVKSAWQDAGRPCPLREFARWLIEANDADASAANAWLSNKTGSKRPRRRSGAECASGHAEVYRNHLHRQTQHSLAGCAPSYPATEGKR